MHGSNPIELTRENFIQRVRDNATTADFFELFYSDVNGALVLNANYETLNEDGEREEHRITFKETLASGETATERAAQYLGDLFTTATDATSLDH